MFPTEWIPRVTIWNPETGFFERVDGPEGFKDYRMALEASRFLVRTEGRMKTLLVALLLLVVGTGTAFAECAWVLWQHVAFYEGGKIKSVRWEREYAFDTRNLCISKVRPDILRTDDRGMLAEKVEFSCWPDTVDPRGPKGK